MKPPAINGAATRIVASENCNVPRCTPSALTNRMPGTDASSGSTLTTARPTPYIAFHRRARADGRGGSEGQVSPAGPSYLAGEPAQRSPAGTRPLTTLPGSISASSPTSAQGINATRVPTRAPAPTRSSPSTSSSPSTHQPCTSTSPSIVAPTPTLNKPVTGGNV